MRKIIILNIIVLIFFIRIISAAHYIVGYVENAKDGTSPNGHTIVLWNPEFGTEDNVSDIIGPSGNSRTNEIYMIDCELLKNGCNVTNVLTLKVINNGDNYVSEEKNVISGGFGYTLVENITLNSPPNITRLEIEDDLIFPENEIDLVPAKTKEIQCTARITEYDGKFSLVNASAVFFDSVNSHINDFDDNNLHYTNQSCEIDYTYGNQNEARVICKFDIWYYANSENWNCVLSVQDNHSIISKKEQTTFINPLLALGVDSAIRFELLGGDVTRESKVNVTNYGNVKINLSLSGYASQEDDGYSMGCNVEGEEVKYIPVEYTKYNLTQSNEGEMNLSEFEKMYTNLTSYPVVKKFNLDYRKNDYQNEAVNDSYWRVYVPQGVSGTCEGNIIFGAVRSPEI